MKTVAIVNPAAAGGRVGRAWTNHERAICERYGAAQVTRTTGPGEATTLTRRALGEGAQRVVALGGDGTLNEVVNGFFDAGTGRPIAPKAVLAYWPAGTGGDFARSLGYARARAAGTRVDTVRAIDVGQVELVGSSGQHERRFFLNISSFGSSGRVARAVNSTTKALGGRASFYLGTLRGLAQHTNSRVRLRVDDAFEEEVRVNTVAVANGRYFGGGMKMAPGARVDDGAFDVVLVGDIGTGFFVQHARKLYAGEHLELPNVRWLRGAKILASPIDRGEVPLEVDGEALGRLPACFTMLAGALRFEAPWETAEAASPVGSEAAASFKSGRGSSAKRPPRSGRAPRRVARTKHSPGG